MICRAANNNARAINTTGMSNVQFIVGFTNGMARAKRPTLLAVKIKLNNNSS